MKKLFAILCIILSLLMLASCGKDNGDVTSADTTEAVTTAPVTTEAATTEAPETEPPAPKGISLINESGRSDYKSVYSKDDGNTVPANLREAVYLEYNAPIFYSVDTSKEVNEFEILFGNTNRPESAEAMKGIGKNDYSVTMINGKLVFAAGSKNALNVALNEFKKLYINADTNKDLFIPEDISIKGTVDSIFQGLSKGWNYLEYEGDNGGKINVAVWLPRELTAEDMQKKEFVLFCFMHGHGSKGSSFEHLSGAAGTMATSVLPKSKYANETIIIAPQYSSTERWVNVDYTPGTCNQPKEISKCLGAAKEVFDIALTDLPINSKRVYGFGNSMGAFSLWDLATRYPDFFTAIVPLAGGGDPKVAAKIKDLNIWAFHGDADPTVNFRGTDEMIKALRAAGAGDNVVFTVKAGGTHGTSSFFVPIAQDPAVLDWMYSKTK